MKYFLLVSFVFVSLSVPIFTLNEANAGIFRRGPMMPWRHQEWKNPNEPVQPIVPVIPPIDPGLTSTPAIQTNDSPITKEEIEIVKQLFSLKPTPDPTPTETPEPQPEGLPLWIPLGGLGAGGLVMLLYKLREGISFIKG